MSSAFEATAHADLGPSQRPGFDVLESDDGYWGLLVPKGRAALGVKAINGDLARWLAVEETSRRFDAEPTDDVLRLILDGVVEIEGDDGFVTGPDALPLLDSSAPLGPFSDRLSRMAREAIELCALVPDHDPKTLATWLYAYNTMPLDEHWRHRFGSDSEALDLALGLGSESDTFRSLARCFDYRPVGMWHSWHRHAADHATHCAYKIYVSPSPDCTIEAFRALAEVMLRADVRAFKIGRGLHGFLRPDKFVIYVDDWASLRAVAIALQSSLANMAAQGVPFTKAIDANGLLSWGMDPPEDSTFVAWRAVESWRTWVINRVARALVVAADWEIDEDTSFRYAMLRLSLEGVDPNSWLPVHTLFRSEVCS